MVEDRSSIPAEFDTLLTRISDNPAVRAVLSALDKNQIKYFVSHDGKVSGRTQSIYIARNNYAFAAEVASRVFAIRKKFNSYAKVEPLPDTPIRGGDLPLLPGS